MRERAPFVEGSRTSAEASDQLSLGKLYVDRARILAWFQNRGAEGGTDEECQIALDLPGDTQRPRRVKLVTDGFLKNAQRARLTSKGRKATVWVAT